MNDAVSPERPPRRPWAYFLTAACYGAHLHGHAEGSVDPGHRAWRGPQVEPSEAFERYERERMKAPPFLMDSARRDTVLEAICGVCAHEGWPIHAAHIRTNHFHLVVAAEPPPEVVLGKLKAYASRALNERFGRRAKYWTRQGSTRWLWTPQEVDGAVEYIVDRQGSPMALYVNPNRWSEYLRT